MKLLNIYLDNTNGDNWILCEDCIKDKDYEEIYPGFLEKLELIKKADNNDICELCQYDNNDGTG